MSSLNFTRENLRHVLRTMETEFNSRNGVSDFIGWQPGQRQLYFALLEIITHHTVDGKTYTLECDWKLGKDFTILVGWIEEEVQKP